MPMPTPRKGEEKDSFISRCMSEMKSPDRTNEQNVAACMDAWRSVHGGKKPKADVAGEDLTIDDCPDPADGESENEFLDRCVEEVLTAKPDAEESEAEAVCQLCWEASGNGARAMKPKQDRKQQVAAIIARWKEIKYDAPFPEEDESEDDFMQRCVDEVTEEGEGEVSQEDGEAICEELWD